MIVTDCAKTEIQKHAKFLKIIAVPGGCAGFKYELSYCSDATNDDVILHECVLTDEASYQFIEGITIDFIDEIGHREFVLKNPAKKGCGCGNSFGQ